MLCSGAQASLVQVAVLRVSWGSGSSLCPSTSGRCLVQEDRGWNSSRSWGREKGGEVSTKLQPRESFHRNLVNHRLRWKRLVCSGPVQHQQPYIKTNSPQPQCTEAKASPTQQGPGCSSLPSHTQAGRWGHLCHPSPLPTHGEDFEGGLHSGASSQGLLTPRGSARTRWSRSSAAARRGGWPGPEWR